LGDEVKVRMGVLINGPGVMCPRLTSAIGVRAGRESVVLVIEAGM